MSTEAIATLGGVLALPLMFLFIYLPDILKSWHTSKAEVVKAETGAANAALKRDMVARGFTADEIATVMNAGHESQVEAEEEDEPEAEAEEKPSVPAGHK